MSFSPLCAVKLAELHPDSCATPHPKSSRANRSAIN
jgi:hypothetical protein